MASINREIKVTASLDDVAKQFEDLKSVGGDMFGEFLSKAQAYTSHLDKQAEKVHRLMSEEKEMNRLVMARRKDEAEARKNEQLSGLKDGDVNSRKRVMDEYKGSIQDINEATREHNIMMSESNRLANEHFNKAEDANREQGKFVNQFSRNALIGGAAGMLGGAGGLPALTSAVFGGIAGSAAAWLNPGMGAPVAAATGAVTGALMTSGMRLSEATAPLRGLTGTESYANLTRYGLSPSESAAIQRASSMAAGQRLGTGDVSQMTAIERASGMDIGSLSGMQGLKAQGVSGDISTLFMQFLQRANNSKLWGVDKDDFSAIPRELQTLGNLIQQEASVMSRPTGVSSMMLRQQFASLGGFFEDARGEGMMMNMHKALQNPANQYVQAFQFENILRSNPNLANDQFGFFKARAIQGQGMFGENYLESTLQRVRDVSPDIMARQAMLTQMVPAFQTFFGSEELKKLVSDESAGKFAGIGGVEQMKKTFDSLGMSEFSDKVLSRAESATSPISVLDAHIKGYMENNGKYVAEAIAGGIDSLLSKVDEAIVLMGGKPQAHPKLPEKPPQRGGAPGGPTGQPKY